MLNREPNKLEVAFSSLDPITPLNGDLLQRYYVDRPRNPFHKVVFCLRNSNKGKVLFSGFRGTGKTTELSRLSMALQDEFFVVYFHAVRSLDILNVDYVQIIFALALEIYKSAVESHLKLSRSLVEEISDLVTIVGVEEEKKRDGEILTSAELNAQIVKLTGTLGLARSRAQTVTKRLEPRFSDLLERLNSLIAEVGKKSKKRVLIIVEDLDKMVYKEQRDLFLRYGEALYSPECHMVYVVTPPLLYEHSTNAPRYSVSNYFLLPHFPVIKRNGELDYGGIQLLKEIVVKRVGEGVFSEKALDHIAVNSGGNVRELLVLARDSVLEALMENAQQVEQRHAKLAVARLRNTLFHLLDQQMFDLLATLVKTGQIPRTETVIRLLHSLVILESQDEAGTWNFVHPCIEPLIRQHLSDQG